MTSSKPTTPVGLRRHFAGEAETTRIPMLSPQPFRRSYSMRLRYSTGSYYNDYQHFGSHYNNANMEQKHRIVCGDGKIKNSKSNSTNDLTKDGTHNKVQPLNGILTNKSGNQQNQQSNARNKISSSTKTDRGMVSIKFSLFLMGVKNKINIHSSQSQHGVQIVKNILISRYVLLLPQHNKHKKCILIS